MALLPTVAEFVTFYTPSLDRPRICFAWNGAHAERFRDANEEFRRAVIKHALADLGAAPIELVRDLFDAETAHAWEAWGVWFAAVHALARELLTRGGVEFVEDYLAGKFRGMDASCAAYFDCPRELTARLLAEVERRLGESPGERRKRLLETGRDLFRDWLADAR